jgi:phage gp36-like protein
VAYATPADLMARYDRNDIGQLVSDDRRAVSEVDLTVNQPCLVALEDASGMVDAALFVGNRYTPADLVTLSVNSASLLTGIVCDIAMARLINRRPGWNPERAKAISELANSHLERLRNGENTFSIVNSNAAESAAEPVTDGPTTLDFNNLNLWRDRTRNFFPIRVLPNNR